MNTNNIKQGDVYKNYPALCRALDINPSTGNAKKAHMKEFSRFFNFHNEGNKIIIDEIYVEPFPRQDARTNGNNSTYRADLEVLIINYFNQHKDISHITLDRLARLIHIYPKQFLTDKEYWVDFGVSELVVEQGVLPKHLSDFFFQSQLKARAIIDDCLHNLSKRGLISLSKDFMVSYSREDFVVEAELKLAILITEAEEQALELLGLTRQQLFFTNDYKRFNEIVLSTLEKQGYKLSHYFKAYHIVLSPDAPSFDNLQVEDAQRNLRNNLKSYLEMHAIKLHEKSKLDFGSRDNFRETEKYLLDFSIIINHFFK